jgi:inosine-uridine preferring nucleoside hydrolase
MLLRWSALIIIFLATLILPPASAEETSPSGKIPILLDTDIGTDVDDAFALALALASPELDLRGVTTVGSEADARASSSTRVSRRSLESLRSCQSGP